MNNLKKIIIGISGGIAAYKIPLLIRLLKKNNIEVKIVVTKNAMEFVTKTTLETLSENNIYLDVFSNNEEYKTGHISITDWADAMIVAPATANVLAKFANGIADDALSTSFLSFNKPIFIAPAMNTKMWDNKATINNISVLKKRGIRFIEPAVGHLACGVEGNGRMEEPETIYSKVLDFLNFDNLIKNKNVLITAGPTYEPIDPVRYIGNRSSGKMGYAIAETFAKKGANVTLISGPVNISTNTKNINVVDVETAEQMHQNCIKHFKNADITIMCSAVADYSPKTKTKTKIKKSKDNLNIELIPTIDIVSELGKKKTKSQLLVGFALETNNEISNAKLKLKNKNLDCIILNSLNDKGSGFEHDTNKITIITKTDEIDVPLKTKNELSVDIFNFLINTFIKK